MNLRDYLVPHHLEECLAMLSAWEGRGRLVAGGTDLVANLEYGKAQAETLIDISSMEDLMGFEIQDHELVVRAGTTHGQISADPRIQQIWPALAKACGSVGSPQIRNVATLAGNVVNAQPAADSAVALVAWEPKGVPSPGRRLKRQTLPGWDEHHRQFAEIPVMGPVPDEGGMSTTVSSHCSACIERSGQPEDHGWKGFVGESRWTGVRQTSAIEVRPLFKGLLS
jgi:hypothetical protein